MSPAPEPMDSSLYTDGPMDEQQPESTEKSEDTDASSAILPKSVLAGHNCSVGDEITMKITRVGENDVEVSYVNSETEEPPEGMGAEAEGAGGDAMPPDGMSSMME